jgi:hypothetical protein
VIKRAHALLVEMDPLLLMLRTSLVALLVNSNDDTPVLLAVAAVTVVALPRPALLRSPWLWGVLFLVIGARQLSGWHQVDDHIVVTTYWCGAIALGLTATDPRRTLAASARLLVGAVFAFAAVWKLRSGEFADGTFFRYSLLLDERFDTVARLIGGTTREALADNVARLGALAGAPRAGGSEQLLEGPRNELVARFFTGWGIVTESAVAVAFLVPLRRAWEWLRPAALVAFAGTTYLVVPIGGFGTLLLVLGSAQAPNDRLRIAFVWAGAGFLLWAGIWPTIFL